MASPRLPSAVGERSTLFSRPPRRSMPRQYRAREATYSYEESENPNNVDEHSAVLPSNEIESTQSGHAESYDRFTVADLSDEIAADEGLSPSSTSQRGHSTPAGRVRHSPAQHDWDYSHGDTNNSSRMPSSPSLQLPPPFSATPRQVSDSSSLPVRTSSDDPRNVYPRATQQGNSMLDGANSSMVYSTDRGEINSSGFLRTNPAYLPRSNGTAIVGGEQGPSSIDAQDGGSSHSPGSNDRVVSYICFIALALRRLTVQSPRESLASRILAAALPVVWGSSRRASSAGEVRPRQLSRTMPAINMHSVVTPPRHSRLAEPELRGGGRSAEAPESPRRSGNAIRTAVVQVRTPMNRYAARRAEAVARTLDRVTPGRFYVYDDRQPAFNQPITAADLPEARHQGAQTAPNRGYRYYLPREGPTGFPESPTTRYFPRRTRPDSPAGLSSPGMEGLYGGTENRADDELYTHAEMLAARERLERTYLDTDLR